LYVRKQPFAEAIDFPARLAAVFEATLSACTLMESEPSLEGRLRFRTGEALFRINDRLEAPNNSETFAAVKQGLETYLANLFRGSSVRLEHRSSEPELFDVNIRAEPAPPNVAALLDRMSQFA